MKKKVSQSTQQKYSNKDWPVYDNLKCDDNFQLPSMLLLYCTGFWLHLMRMVPCLIFITTEGETSQSRYVGRMENSWLVITWLTTFSLVIFECFINQDDDIFGMTITPLKIILNLFWILIPKLKRSAVQNVRYGNLLHENAMAQLTELQLVMPCRNVICALLIARIRLWRGINRDNH